MQGYTITNVSVNQYGPGCVWQPFNHNRIHVLNFVFVGTPYRWCITSSFPDSKSDSEIIEMRGSRRMACKMRFMRWPAVCLLCLSSRARDMHSVLRRGNVESAALGFEEHRDKSPITFWRKVHAPAEVDGANTELSWPWMNWVDNEFHKF
jgi:hypothetical protein